MVPITNVNHVFIVAVNVILCAVTHGITVEVVTMSLLNTATKVLCMNVNYPSYCICEYGLFYCISNVSP